MPLRERVEPRGRREERGNRRRRDARHRALERRHALAPHARAAHGCRRRRAAAHHCGDDGDRVHVLRELPDRERGRVAFRLQRSQDAHRARGIAGKPRLRQLEDVVARHVGHGAFHGRVVELAFRQEQRELLDLLPRGEQVAFAGVGEERERLARRALLLAREAVGDPARQLVAVDRIDRDGDARVLERGEPGRRLRGAIDARQRDERDVVGVGIARVRLRAPCRLRRPACRTGCAGRRTCGRRRGSRSHWPR